MRRRLLHGLGVIGAVMVIQSILWEIARMKPDYGFLVSPWSIRGFDTVHGTIYTVIGIAMLGAVVLTMWQRSLEPRIGFAIVGYMVVAPVAITAIFGHEPKRSIAGVKLLDAEGNFINEAARVQLPTGATVGAITLIVTVLAFLLMREKLAARVGILRRRGGVPVATLVTLVVTYLVAGTLLAEKEIELFAWLAMLIVMLVLATFAVLFRPRELAANRMLMAVSVVAGAAIGISAGAVRSTLLRFQVAEIGTAAQYKDAQVTWGYFLANIGIMLIFVGAVAAWARRRDHILNVQRARRQREAAEASAAEINAALEQAGS